jgi:hypothetical protein
MQSVLQQSFAPSYTKTVIRASIWTRFITWCKAQQEDRLLWLAIALAGHGCILTPLTVYIVMAMGNSMFLWSFAIAAMGIALVTNLAALPTRVTIPAFIFSILLDLGIIIASVAMWP